MSASRMAIEQDRKAIEQIISNKQPRAVWTLVAKVK
jgi:hypothetical protein